MKVSPSRPAAHLRWGKPRGASGSRRAHTASVCQRTSAGGKAQKPQLDGPAHCFGKGEQRREKWYVGSFGRKRPGYLAGGESSEGRIPKALPVRNKIGKASRGVNRRVGGETLRAERGGQARPVARWTLVAACAMGNKSP